LIQKKGVVFNTLPFSFIPNAKLYLHHVK